MSAPQQGPEAAEQVIANLGSQVAVTQYRLMVAEEALAAERAEHAELAAKYDELKSAMDSLSADKEPPAKTARPRAV